MNVIDINFMWEGLMLEVIIIITIIALDQITKYFTVKNLKTDGSFTVIKGFLEFCYVENRGAAFGILQNKRWFFIVLTIIICAGMAYYLFTYKDTRMILRISLAFILGGAIGNLIDRIRLGYVVDMIHITAINYPVFNVADSFVVIGTILLAWYLLFIADK
jgi:signal peptidase II